MGLDRDEAPYVSIPLNTVIELTPNAYGCEEKRYLLLSKEEMMKDGQESPRWYFFILCMCLYDVFN